MLRSVHGAYGARDWWPNEFAHPEGNRVEWSIFNTSMRYPQNHAKPLERHYHIEVERTEFVLWSINAMES